MSQIPKTSLIILTQNPNPIAKAEVTYPAEESVTGGILSLCNNAGGLVLLVVLPSIPDSYNSLVMGLAVVLGTVVLIFVSVRYKRSEVDMDGEYTRSEVDIVTGGKELAEPFVDK